MRKSFAPLLLIVVSMLVPVGKLRAEINDEALIFSAEALQEAYSIVEDVKRNTTPKKEIALRTVPSLPSNDSSAKAMAERLYTEQHLNGVLILVVKSPPQILFAAGDNTTKKVKDLQKLRTDMIHQFKAEDYDGGMLAALRVLRDELKSNFPLVTLAGKVKAPPKSAAPSAGKKGWLNFQIPNTFFYVMFGVLAYLLLPWRQFLGGSRFGDSSLVGKMRQRLPGGKNSGGPGTR